MLFKNKYYTGILIAAILLSLSVIYLHLMSHQKTKEIFIEQTVETITNKKREFLKDTIDNLIVEIDRLRESKHISYRRNVESRLRRFQDELNLSDQEFIEFYRDRFNDDSSSMWTAILWNDKTQQVYYRTANLDEASVAETIASLQKSLSSFVVVDKGDIRGMFGISHTYIEETAKKEIADVVRVDSKM